MLKQYKYSEFKKDGWPSQKKACIYRGIFVFKEISEPPAEPSKEKIESVIVEIPLSMIQGWKANSKQAKNGQLLGDDDLIEVLAGIAKEHGLKKGSNFINISAETYLEGIVEFEEYRIKKNDIFTIEFPKKAIGFQSELD
jgi:hypothetical protein